jgi:hypothetical protein
MKLILMALLLSSCGPAEFMMVGEAVKPAESHDGAPGPVGPVGPPPAQTIDDDDGFTPIRVFVCHKHKTHRVCHFHLDYRPGPCNDRD